MRLKEDSSSYRAIGLKIKYAELKPATRRSRKNTNKWCKGKVGVEHEWEHIVPQNSRSWPFRKLDVCKNCNKQNHKNYSYWCREHQTWDRKIWWNNDHTHESMV